MKNWLVSIDRFIGHSAHALALLHIVCIAICISLAGGSHWLFNRPNDSSLVDVALPLPIEEAERLVAGAATWNDEYMKQSALNEQLLANAQQAIAWVPESIDWRKTIAEIQSLAEQSDLVLVELRPGDEFNGPRVTIHAAVCQLEGSYGSICRFLDGLTKRQHPIWANELTMQNDSDGGPLTVVVHLRVPVASKRCAGAFLIEKLSHESDQNRQPQNTVSDEVAVSMETNYRGY